MDQTHMLTAQQRERNCQKKITKVYPTKPVPFRDLLWIWYWLPACKKCPPKEICQCGCCSRLLPSQTLLHCVELCVYGRAAGRMGGWVDWIASHQHVLGSQSSGLPPRLCGLNTHKNRTMRYLGTCTWSCARGDEMPLDGHGPPCIPASVPARRVEIEVDSGLPTSWEAPTLAGLRQGPGATFSGALLFFAFRPCPSQGTRAGPTRARSPPLPSPRWPLKLA